MHARWAASKLDVLRSRSGSGFKQKLRQRWGADESRIYKWLCMHASNLDPSSVLAQQLATLDAFVRRSDDALMQELQVHAHWVASKLDVLRSRSGCGVKEKLRVLGCAEERQIYEWLRQHASAQEPASLLAQHLVECGCLLYQLTAKEMMPLDYTVGAAAPAHARQDAEPDVEAIGEHVGAKAACQSPRLFEEETTVAAAMGVV